VPDEKMFLGDWIDKHFGRGLGLNSQDLRAQLAVKESEVAQLRHLLSMTELWEAKCAAALAALEDRDVILIQDRRTSKRPPL